MIEGIKLDFTSDELKAHVDARAQHHADRAAWYGSQVASLKEGGELGDSGVSNNPVHSLQSSQRDHEAKASLFRVISEHVIPSEIYRLSEADLTRIEIVSRYY